MSWYKEHKQEWKEIIETISREVNRTPQMNYKDIALIKAFKVKSC